MIKKIHPVVEKITAVVEPVETTFKKVSIILCSIALSIFLISCASTKNPDATSSGPHSKGLRPIYITNSKKVNLLGPENAGTVFDGLQLLNGSFGDTSFALLSYTQLDAKEISLSLMNDFGADMGSVFYDGQKVIFDSAYFPKALPGEYIICDIQNAYYDEDALRDNYESAGLAFEVWPAAVDVVTATGGAGRGTGGVSGEGVREIRRISDGKKLIEEITILENTITIKNYLRGYEYNLMKVEE